MLVQNLCIVKFICMKNIRYYKTICDSFEQQDITKQYVILHFLSIPMLHRKKNQNQE